MDGITYFTILLIVAVAFGSVTYVAGQLLTATLRWLEDRQQRIAYERLIMAEKLRLNALYGKRMQAHPTRGWRHDAVSDDR